MRRILLATSFTLLALAPAAQAATVSVQDPARKIRFEAALGEVNRVTVSQAGSVVTIEDTGAPMTVASNQTACVADGPNKALCTLPSDLYRVQIDGNDGDDELSGSTTATVKLSGEDGADRITGGPASDDLSGGAGNDVIDGAGGTDSVDGGDGDDTIHARDALRDAIICGLGTDTGEADLEDEVNADCESVVKPLIPPTVADGDGQASDPGLQLGALPKPVPGQRVAVGITSGTARVKLPGKAAYVALDPTKPVPVGSTLDARSGVITLLASKDLTGGTQSAKFTGGVFTVGQKRASRMTTVLALRGGDFSKCRRTARTAARAAAGKPVRRLWGSGHGRFTTRGRNSAATVRGTIWSVSDTCAGTVTRVQRGLVAVQDFRTKRTRLVRAGGSYLARRR